MLGTARDSARATPTAISLQPDCLRKFSTIFAPQHYTLYSVLKPLLLYHRSVLRASFVRLLHAVRWLSALPYLLISRFSALSTSYSVLSLFCLALSSYSVLSLTIARMCP